MVSLVSHVLHFFAFCCDLMFKMNSKHSDEVLSIVPKYKTAVMCLLEKICVLDKVHFGKSYSAVSCEVNVMNQQ